MLLNGKLADIAAMGSALAAFFVFDATACGSGAPRRAQKPSITLDGAIVVDAPPTGVYKRAFTYWAPIIGPGATNIAEAPSSVHTTDHRFQYRGRTIRDGSDEIQYPCCQGHLFDDLRIVPPASAPIFRGSRLQQQRRIVADIFSIGSASAPNELFLGRRVCACSLRILSRLRCHHLSPTSVRTDAAI